MDAASWTAIIGPITTLLGGLGGYWLAGRNDDARDQRAAVREVQARRNALAERLEEDRHAFQRDVLLGLQDELQRLVRNTAQVMLQDQKTIKETGQMYLLAGDLSDQGMQINVSVSRLRARVLDDELRDAVEEFSALCSGLQLRFLPEFTQGKVPNDQKDRVIAQLQRQTVKITQAYTTLTELVGRHLRRELDRRYLVAAPERDPG